MEERLEIEHGRSKSATAADVMDLALAACHTEFAAESIDNDKKEAHNAVRA